MEYSIKPKRLGERRIIHYPQKRIIGLYVISMSIFEYDKDEEEKKLRKAEYEAGVQVGMEAKMKNLIKKKLEKGKCIEVIAEELEEDITSIRKLIDELE